MLLRNTSERFGLPAQILHWLVALLIILLFVVGLWMGDLPKGDLRGAVFGMHKAFGVLVVMLVAARLAWRLANPVPRQPEGTPAWQHRLASLMHAALYLLMFAVPVVGVLMSDTAGRPTSFFGLFTLPTLLERNEALHEGLEEAHEALAFLLMGLVVAHVAAALWHHLVLKDGILRRMLPGRA